MSVKVGFPAGRLRDKLSATASKRIRFAAATTNVPPGQPKKLRLKLTRKGKRTATMLIRQGTRKLRGVFEIPPHGEAEVRGAARVDGFGRKRTGKGERGDRSYFLRGPYLLGEAPTGGEEIGLVANKSVPCCPAWEAVTRPVSAAFGG